MAERPMQIRHVEDDPVEAESSARRWRFLAEASRVFSSSLCYETTLRTVAELAVQAVGNYCFVDLLEGEELRRVAAADVDPGRWAAAERARRYPVLRSRRTNPSIVALESGKPVFALLDEGGRASYAQSDEHRAVMEELGGRSMLSVPLVARDRTLGVMIFADRSPTPRLEAGEDRALAEELAGRAALAVDNALLYQQAQAAARRRDEVIGMVTHDLRSPLNVILMVLAALRRDLGPTAERVQKRLEAMERSTDRMTRLIQDLLDATRSEEEEPPVTPGI